VDSCFLIICRFLLTIDNLFSEKNQKLFDIVNIFNPLSKEYFDHTSSSLNCFLTHYAYFKINAIKVPSEFQSAKILLEKNNDIDMTTINNSLSKLSSAFSETLKVLSIVLTLHCTTASNERVFSSLKKVNSFLRLSMNDDRLNDLMVINVESSEANGINLQEALIVFSNMKTRRYPLV